MAIKLQIQCKYGELYDLFKRVSHCMSNEITRYYLNGVCIEKKGNKIYAVATDGRRLMASRIDGEYETPVCSKGDFSLIIPSTMIKRMKASGRRNLVIFTLESRTCTIDYLDFKETHKLVDGTYPSWQKMVDDIKTTDEPMLSFNAKYLADMCAAVGSETLTLYRPEVGEGGDISAAPQKITTEAGDIYILMPMRT